MKLSIIDENGITLGTSPPLLGGRPYHININRELYDDLVDHLKSIDRKISTTIFQNGFPDSTVDLIAELTPEESSFISLKFGSKNIDIPKYIESQKE